nr:MAG TPA: hypothetical protein [Bacteriophage sp.]
MVNSSGLASIFTSQLLSCSPKKSLSLSLASFALLVKLSSLICANRSYASSSASANFYVPTSHVLESSIASA